MKVPFSDSSADPLLDEHFRRSLGANYETLFKKNSSSSCSESGSSSTESSPPKVPQLLLTKKDSSKTESSDKSQELDPTKVPDPVKAFREDMNMEGYTGKKIIVSCLSGGSIWKLWYLRPFLHFLVEDHFAKALGDTWIKLQKAEEEKRSKTQLNNNQNKSESSTETSTTTTKQALVATS